MKTRKIARARSNAFPFSWTSRAHNSATISLERSSSILAMPRERSVQSTHSHPVVTSVSPLARVLLPPPPALFLACRVRQVARFAFAEIFPSDLLALLVCADILETRKSDRCIKAIAIASGNLEGKWIEHTLTRLDLRFIVHLVCPATPQREIYNATLYAIPLLHERKWNALFYLITTILLEYVFLTIQAYMYIFQFFIEFKPYQVVKMLRMMILTLTHTEKIEF